MNEHDYQRFLSDAEGCDSETSTPGALTRESVENAIEGGDAAMFMRHDPITDILAALQQGGKK